MENKKHLAKKYEKIFKIEDEIEQKFKKYAKIHEKLGLKHQGFIRHFFGDYEIEVIYKMNKNEEIMDFEETMKILKISAHSPSLSSFEKEFCNLCIHSPIEIAKRLVDALPTTLLSIIESYKSKKRIEMRRLYQVWYGGKGKTNNVIWTSSLENAREIAKQVEVPEGQIVRILLDIEDFRKEKKIIKKQR